MSTQIGALEGAKEKPAMSKNSMSFIGLDLGDRQSYLILLDSGGELVEEGRLPTTRAAFQRRFSTMPPCQVAMEVGTHSRWASNLLQRLGHEVLLARMDPHLLSPIHHRSPQAQADLAVLRSRDAQVRCRTLLINHVRSVVKSSGSRFPSCSAASFPKKVTASIPEPLRPALLPLLETITGLTQQIQAYDRQIETLCESQYPDTRSLRQVPGVGALTALAFVLTLEDPTRFAKSREVGPALGLVPRRDQSGDRDPQLPIAKTGNEFLRRLLVGSAHYVLGPFGPDCDLRRWGLQLAERGGKNAKKRAVVAVARKLAVLLHRLWKTGEIYEPFYSSAPQPNLLEVIPTVA
jgi:transposase